jgi:thiamine-phosphate pyrophosphorylase
MSRPISKLQFITTSAADAEEACSGGVEWIQLRLKNISYNDYRKAAFAVQFVCKKFDATFIINDNIQLALEINADGVHVGKDDPLPQKDIDKMLARGGIIGCTANTIEDFIHLEGKGVSYIGLGPFRFTDTKQNLSPVLGLEGYRRLFSEIQERGLTPPPIVGIGGIKEKDVPALLTTGLHGIAVSGAIAKAKDIEKAAYRFSELLNN